MNIMKKSIMYLTILSIIVLFSIFLIIVSGADVSIAFSSFLTGTFGSTYAFGEVIVKMIPLLIAGLGVSVAFKTGFINLGAEGQIYMGAIAATAVIVLIPKAPMLVIVTLCMFAGFILAGIWAIIPGFLKARFNLSEVINTIMLNYIAIFLVGILVRTVLQDPNSAFPMSVLFPKTSWLPIILPGSRLHLGIIIGLILALIVWFLLWKTKFGYEMRAVGVNSRGCLCSGISSQKNIVLSSLLSGGLAGIAGVCEVLGLHHKLLEGITPNYGYLAIIVALLGKNHPVGIILSSFFLAMIQVGSLSMQRSSGIPSSISSIILSIIVIIILTYEIFVKKFTKINSKSLEIEGEVK